MVNKLPLIGLIGLAGCIGTATLPPEIRPTDEHSKRAEVVREYSNRQAWERSGYARLDDDAKITYPVFLAIAGDGTACFLSPERWALNPTGKMVPCFTGWRVYRGGR